MVRIPQPQKKNQYKIKRKKAAGSLGFRPTDLILFTYLSLSVIFFSDPPKYPSQLSQRPPVYDRCGFCLEFRFFSCHSTFSVPQVSLLSSFRTRNPPTLPKPTHTGPTRDRPASPLIPEVPGGGVGSIPSGPTAVPSFDLTPSPPQPGRCLEAKGARSLFCLILQCFFCSFFAASGSKQYSMSEFWLTLSKLEISL